MKKEMQSITKVTKKVMSFFFIASPVDWPKFVHKMSSGSGASLMTAAILPPSGF